MENSGSMEVCYGNRTDKSLTKAGTQFPRTKLAKQGICEVIRLGVED